MAYTIKPLSLQVRLGEQMSAHERAKLSGAQQQVLYEMVVAGPLANGFDCGVWTTAMLVELIGRRWGVCYLCINSNL